MSRQILVPHTTAKGGLFSITDQYPQYPRGQIYEAVDKNGNTAEFEYLYNAVGAACVAGVFNLKFLGASATSPGVDGLTASNNEIGEIAIAQAAIPTLYWGWHLTKGKSSVSGVKMIWSGVTYTDTDDCTAGETFTITNNIAACDNAAMTYQTDVPITISGVCAETLATAALSVHVELLGGLVKCAT